MTISMDSTINGRVNGHANGRFHSAAGEPLDLTVLGLNSGTSMVIWRWSNMMLCFLLTINRETGWH